MTMCAYSVHLKQYDSDWHLPLAISSKLPQFIAGCGSVMVGLQWTRHTWKQASSVSMYLLPMLSHHLDRTGFGTPVTSQQMH